MGEIDPKAERAARAAEWLDAQKKAHRAAAIDPALRQAMIAFDEVSKELFGSYQTTARTKEAVEKILAAHASHLPHAERAGAGAASDLEGELWAIIDRDGLGDVPSDIKGAVARLVYLAKNPTPPSPPAPLSTPQGEGAAIKTRSNSDVAPLDAAAVRAAALEEAASLHDRAAERLTAQQEAGDYTLGPDIRHHQLWAKDIRALIGEGEGK